MNKLLFILLFFSANSQAQSYADAPGTPTTTAISKDSSVFVFWANAAQVQRGFVYINDTTFQDNGTNKASYGLTNYALGPAEGDGVTVISLGDGGMITLGFPEPITDGPNWDFAVFENSFQDHYMELAFVEVSSNGIDFVRFPSDSKIPTSSQLGNFSSSDCKLVNNLAGKYKAGFGTPFDLSEVAGLHDSVDVNRITHVRIIDVVGTISGEHIQFDASGDTINDPFPTPYYSCGFDLDAVGVIHPFLSLEKEVDNDFVIYPNPTNGWISIVSQHINDDMKLVNVMGEQVLFIPTATETIDLAGLQPGIYFLIIGNQSFKIEYRP